MITVRRFILLVVSLALVHPAALIADTRFGDEVVVSSGRTVEEAVSIGEDVRVLGTVEENAVSLGGDVIIESGGAVWGEAVSLGGDVIVKRGGEVNDARSIGGEVKIREGGRVTGDIDDFSGFPVPNIVGALPHIAMGLPRLLFLGPLAGLFGTMPFFFGFLFMLIKVAIALAVAVVITFIFPERISHMAVYLKTDFPKAFLLGLVLTLLIPVFVILLLITIIGIPLIPLFMVLLFLSYLFGSVGIALWAGRIIPESEGRTLLVNVILGTVAIAIIKYLPIIGAIVGFVFWSAAIGGVFLTKYGTK